MRGALPILLVSAVVIGCSSNKTKAPEPVPATDARTAAAPASASSDGLTGKVLERLDAPPYSYLSLETAKGVVWAAVPQAKVEKGADVTVFNSMLMANFESKTLKRTFKEIYFGTLTPTGADAAPGGNPHAGAPQSAVPVEVGKIEKATGADAHTVAEVWAQKESLKGRAVTIRGMVVKYNDGVMGKNWIHLQDGSGDAKRGTNDITVTSLDAATRGEVITVQGTVRTDKDFGAGYVYAIIVEDAKVVKK